MGRNLSPLLRRELSNLHKDADSRKSSMKAIRSYVKDLDAKAIPVFLAQVSETLPGMASGEDIIFLYEVLVQVHGSNVVPHIDNIMMSILKILKSSAGSFALCQECSKVVPAFAKYGIDTSIPDREKAKIIRSLCKPLCDLLMGFSEKVTSGAALCLKALVESDGWRFAPDDVVNDICLRTAGALQEKLSQTNIHMGLAMALAKQNSLTIEAFARSLILSGLQIVTTGNGTRQKRLSAIHMINFLMKCVDPRSISSELVTIVDVMEKCHKDQMPFVRGAAFEALQTAKTVAVEKGSKILKDSIPITGSNFSKRRDNGSMSNVSGNRVDLSRSASRSPRSLSPESWTFDSFSGFDSPTESLLSTGQASCNVGYNRFANRRLWKNENGDVDVSLKDGLYSEVNSSCNFSETYKDHFEDSELSDTERSYPQVFTGYVPESPTCMKSQGTTPTHQKLQMHLCTDNIEIFTTPRKLMCSLQEVEDCDLEFSEKQSQKIERLTSCKVDESLIREVSGFDDSQNLSYEVEGNNPARRETYVTDDDLVPDDFEVVSSTGDAYVTDDDLVPDDLEVLSSTGDASVTSSCEVQNEVGQKDNVIENVNWKMRSFRKVSLSLVCGITLLLPAVILSTLWLDNEEECFNLVPT